LASILDGFSTIVVSHPNSSATLSEAHQEDSSSVPSKKGKCKRVIPLSGTVRRSARLLSLRSPSSGKSLGSSTTDGASNSGSGMVPILGSILSSYVLGSLSPSDFCHLASNSGIVFSDIDLDITFIKSRELERAKTSRS